MDVKDIIVAGTALVGAVLGIFNFLRAYLVESERGSVGIVEGNDRDHPGVVVANHNAFPITITELGTVHPDGKVEDVRLQRAGSYGNSENRLPRRIEPRDSHFFHIDMHETISRVVKRPTYTYARTALGTIFTTEPRIARLCRRAKETLRIKKRDL